MSEWTWFRKSPRRIAISAADRAYREKVTRNKDRAGRKRRHADEKTEAERIRELNDAPLY